MRNHTIYGVKHTFHIQMKIYPMKLVTNTFHYNKIENYNFKTHTVQ
jgi:hypothetical protein